MKKIFAFFISFALIIGFMPFIESPAKAYNYGDPVETAQDLCDLRDYLNSNPAMQNSVITFKNNAVIDLTGINWEPILYFNGHIFGNGATIRGLYIDPYDGETNGGWQHFGGLNNVGFISVMEHTEVENLNIEVDHIEGHHLVGALCGQAMSSYIHDCTVGAVNDKWMLDEGIITGICGVGGFAGGFANGASDPYTDNDLYGNSTEGVIADCVTLYPLQIFTSNEYSSDQAVPYSSSLNRNADYKNAPDYICANTSVGSIYDYPPYDSATGKRLEEGFFAGGFVGLAWESPCNYFNCVNNAFVSASIGGAGGIIGHTVNGAIIRQCSNTGYILGSDRGACMFTLEHEEYFGDNQYLRLMPFKSLRHPDTFTSYYECNEGIAGIVGISGAGTLIEDCANEGPIEGQKELGGIAGIVLEAFSTSDSCLNTRITDSYNAGALFTKDTLIIGGIAGYVAPFSTVYTPQGGSSCPYCSGGSSQNSPSGYCDNIIENCFNIGGVLASVTIGGPLIQRYPDNVNSATNSTFFYGGIVGENNGIIRNCYSNLDNIRYPVSICLNNFGLIDHCFGRASDCQGISGVSGTVIDYIKYDDNSTGQVSDVFELSSPGSLTGGTSLLDELNAWVARNQAYTFLWSLTRYANISYRSWITAPEGYEVFGSRQSLYLLTYNANGGSGAPPASPGVPGSTVMLDSGSTLYRSGCIFLGWSDNPNDTFPPFSGGQPYTLTSNTTLYAIWAQAATLYYGPNGGTNPPAPVTAIPGTTVALDSGASLIRPGYTFIGWANSSSASTPDYQPGYAGYVLSSNTTLYAVWAQNVTLTYDANGGSNAPTSQTGYGQITLSTASPSNGNYVFMGWTTTRYSMPDSAINPRLIGPGSSYNLTQNTTLYAYWATASAVTPRAVPSYETGVRNNPLVWTVTTSTDTAWIKLTSSYKNSSGESYSNDTFYKYSQSNSAISVTDSGDVRTWVISSSAAYPGNDDSVIQNWKVSSKAAGSSVWESVAIDTESANADSSIDITVAKNQAVLESAQNPDPPAYEPYTLIDFSADREAADAGEYVYFTVTTTPDVSKVRISYTSAATGKKKSYTYQTSSTSVTGYEVSADGGSVIWTVRYKITEPASGNIFTAECRGSQWAGAKSLPIVVA